MAAFTLTPEVLDIIRRGTVEGDSFRLPEGQLDRPTYDAVAKALDNLGGKWDRKTRTHKFSLGDPKPLIAALLNDGKAQDIQKDLQFFETPNRLAVQLCDWAAICGLDRVLEPSAGRGAIAKEARRTGGIVEVAEIHPPFLTELGELGFSVIGSDFLQVKPNSQRFYDRVVMNPPFSKGQEVDHVRHACKFLTPAGVLVSVMSSAVKHNSSKKYAEFRAWLQGVRGEIWNLPDGTFKESGAGVTSVVVRIVGARF